MRRRRRRRRIARAYSAALLTTLQKAWPAGWKAQASDNGGFFRCFRWTREQARARATFFPLEEEQVDNASAAQGVMPTARGLQIKLKKSDQLLKPIQALKGVVVLESGPHI